MKTKAIIFDLDGTAVDSPANNLPSERLIRAIAALKNDFWLCVATGRAWSYGKDVIQKLELEDPCVIAAGTQICNPQTGEILWQKNINLEDIKKVMQIFRRYLDTAMLFNDYSLDDYLSKNYKVKDCLVKGEVFFLELVDIGENMARVVEAELRNIKGVACIVVVGQHNKSHRDIHVTNAQATKEQAIAELLKIIKVERKNTIGVGDGANDIHLFNAVGTKVAMGNAVVGLKRRADLVIDSVKDDGLAKYFESLV